MRPVYLMPQAGQVLSTIIPSRWSFEANLLHEAADSEWDANKPMPDYTCNITLPQAPAGNQPMPPMASMPPGSSMPTESSMPTGSFDPADLNPSLHIQGDPAEGSIHRYIITFTDVGGTRHTCRASADEQYPHLNPVAHATSHRHSFRDSFSVLAAMLVVLIAGVIAILRKRDNDPQ
jgi:hypothetical protein